MKILVCSLTYPLPNGVTSSLTTSVDGFLAAGHQVRIVAPDYGKGKVRPEHFPVPSSIIGRVITGLFQKEERMFGLGARGQIKKIVEEFSPDAFWLHTVTWSANAFENVMLKSKKPTVLTYHTLVENYGRVYAGEIGAQRMATRSKELADSVNQIIAPSHVVESKLRAYGVTKPITVIPTGIHDPGQQYSKSELANHFDFSADVPVLLYLGRVSKEKNIAGLLEMAAKLKQNLDNFVLLLVGPGDIEETNAQALELKLDKNVICTGPLPKAEAQKVYGGADLFVFASQSETQGLVVGEAMIAGLPVVALNSPVQPEVYPENVAVVAKNTDEFATAVADLLKDEPRRAHLAQVGKEFVTKNFSIEGMIRKQIELFENLSI